MRPAPENPELKASNEDDIILVKEVFQTSFIEPISPKKEDSDPTAKDNHLSKEKVSLNAQIPGKSLLKTHGSLKGGNESHKRSSRRVNRCESEKHANKIIKEFYASNPSEKSIIERKRHVENLVRQDIKSYKPIHTKEYGLIIPQKGIQLVDMLERFNERNPKYPAKLKTYWKLLQKMGVRLACNLTSRSKKRGYEEKVIGIASNMFSH